MNYAASVTIMDSVASWQFWVPVLVGAIVGLVITKLWDNSLSRRLVAWRAGARRALDIRRGAPPTGGRNPRPGSVLPEYFRQQQGKLDLAIYELSLRPNVPVMDLLYFEYLRGRLVDGSIREVMVVPWSGWRDDKNAEAEARIQQNIDAVFGDVADRVSVVTASELQQHGETIFSNDFFKQVGSLGDSSFLRDASTVMGYRFRSYHDINQGHPETHQARSIVEHTVRGWLIYKHIEKTRLGREGAPRQIGSLMWESELTKLLLLRYLQAAHRREVECSLMLGRTVTFRRRGRKPLPTFAGESIEMFGNFDAQAALLARKGKAELRRTQEVLGAILDDKSALSGLSVWGSERQRDAHVPKMSREALAVLTTVERLREVYGVS